mmetsp:Transcript_43212/g.124914  ORF Transcript_43212/g.124914 Transcript_43212/m.124914 type:complete len:233 (+) Transcript_43212:1760-2458(+)
MHQGASASNPLLLGRRQQVVPALLTLFHKSVHDDTHAEVHQKHEAQKDPEYKEDHPQGVVRIADGLDEVVDGVRRGVHDIDPTLRGGDLGERHHRVPDIVEVLTQHRHPVRALLVAQCSIFDQGRAKVRALASRLALLEAGLAYGGVHVGLATRRAEEGMRVRALGLARLLPPRVDVGAAEGLATAQRSHRRLGAGHRALERAPCTRQRVPCLHGRDIIHTYLLLRGHCMRV